MRRNVTSNLYKLIKPLLTGTRAPPVRSSPCWASLGVGSGVGLLFMLGSSSRAPLAARVNASDPEREQQEVRMVAGLMSRLRSRDLAKFELL